MGSTLSVTQTKAAWMSSASGAGIQLKKKKKPTIYTRVHKCYFPGTNKVKVYCVGVLKGPAVLEMMFFKV